MAGFIDPQTLLLPDYSDTWHASTKASVSELNDSSFVHFGEEAIFTAFITSSPQLLPQVEVTSCGTRLGDAGTPEAADTHERATDPLMEPLVTRSPSDADQHRTQDPKPTLDVTPSIDLHHEAESPESQMLLDPQQSSLGCKQPLEEEPCDAEQPEPQTSEPCSTNEVELSIESRGDLAPIDSRVLLDTQQPQDCTFVNNEGDKCHANPVEPAKCSDDKPSTDMNCETESPELRPEAIPPETGTQRELQPAEPTKCSDTKPSTNRRCNSEPPKPRAEAIPLERYAESLKPRQASSEIPKNNDTVNGNQPSDGRTSQFEGVTFLAYYPEEGRALVEVKCKDRVKRRLRVSDRNKEFFLMDVAADDVPEDAVVYLKTRKARGARPKRRREPDVDEQLRKKRKSRRRRLDGE